MYTKMFWRLKCDLKGREREGRWEREIYICINGRKIRRGYRLDNKKIKEDEKENNNKKKFATKVISIQCKMYYSPYDR